MEMSVIDQARRKFLYLVLILAVIQAGAFLVYDILIPPALAKDLILNIGTILITGASYLWTKKSSDTKNISRVLAAVFMLALFYFTYTVVNPFLAGVFFPIFPLFAFFLRGKKEGIIWLVVYLAGIFAYFSAAYFGLISAPYLFSSGLTTVIISLFIYLLVIYFYVDVEEKSRQLLTNQSQKQEEINKQLTLEVEARKKAELELRQNAERLKEMNDAMVGRELKMTELKKKIVQLEEERGKQ